jgi:hypothetical protein
MNRISEEVAISCLPIDITSATTFYAPAMKIHGAQSVAFVVGMGPAVAGQGMTITGQQAETVATVESSLAAAITGATASIGSTIANYVHKATRVRIAISSAVTDAQTIVINGTTLTNATAVSATGLTFGATAGATDAAGVATIVASLTTMINKNFPKLTATTGASWVDVQVNCTASTNISLLTTGGGITPSYRAAYTVLDIMTAGLDSTSEYVSVALSSASTAIAGSFVCMRYGNALPARNRGQIVIDKNT